MFKNIQTKIVAITMAIILSSYVLLSILFLFFAQRYTINQRSNAMKAVINNANTYLAFKLEHGLGVLTQNELSSLGLFEEIYDSEIYLTDIAGTIIYPYNTATRKIPISIINEIKENGEYVGIGNLGGILDSQKVIFASPGVLSNNSVYGFILATYDVSGYSELVVSLSRLLLIAILLTLVATFLVTLFSTRQMVKPLKDMGKAAKEYAKGNFETRIEAKGKDEVTELAASLNNMADSLGRLEQMRRSFISNVSHDLRTPMTSISGFVDGILDGTIPPESTDYYLGLVSEETKRLSRLVRTLLDISRLESGGVSLKIGNYDICEMLRQVVVSFEGKILEKNLKLRFELCDEAVMVVSDTDSIYRVLYNLVDNAIKFSYNEGMLTLSVWKNDSKAIISVRNTGYGIKKDDLPFVFDRFYKTDKSRGLDKSGVGLGLYIAKTIVEKHGGEIAVHSQENEYCEFTFTLPLAEEDKKR